MCKYLSQLSVNIVVIDLDYQIKLNFIRFIKRKTLVQADIFFISYFILLFSTFYKQV